MNSTMNMFLTNTTLTTDWSNAPPQLGVAWGWPGCPYPPPLPQRSKYEIAAKWVWLIVPIILIVVGTFGNLITIAVICRRPRKLSSTGIYLLSLSVADTIFLFVEPLHAWLLRLTGYNIRGVSNWACKTSIFFAFSSFHASAWILAAVTMERAFSVIYPYKVRQLCTKRSAAVVTTSIMLAMLTINSHLLYGFGSPPLEIYEGFDECMPAHEEYSTFFHVYWSWLHIILAFVTPFVIMVTGNALVIRGLHRMRTCERRMENEAELRDVRKKLHHSKHSKLLTLVIVLLNVVFFISQTPLAVYFVIFPYLVEEANVLACTDFISYKDRVDKLMLYEAITMNLSYLNSSVNFILYVLSGSRFRNEIVRLIKCSTTSPVKHGSTRTVSLRSDTSKDHHNIHLFM